MKSYLSHPWFAFSLDAKPLQLLRSDAPLPPPKMVGFRNLAVHEYQSLDLDVLRSILEKNLGNFEEFYTSIINHFNLGSDW